MPLEFSTIIVHHNAPDDLKVCLASVRKAAGNFSHEAIVVDNASENIEALEQEFPWVKWIRNKSNMGWATAVNQGVRAGQGEILVLLNQDAELSSSALQELRRFFAERESEKIGPVGGKLLFSDNRRQPSCGPFPHLGNLIWRRVLPRKNRRYYLLRNPATAAQVDWVTGAFMAVSRHVFDRLGGFENGFFLYYDDVDFCLRAQKEGYAVYYIPQATAFHHHPHAVRRDPKPELRKIIQDSRLLYFKKHRPRWEFWVLEKLQRLSPNI